MSPSVEEAFAFLKGLPIPHIKRNRLCMVPPSGRRVYLYTTKSAIRCFSRLKLDQYLLSEAVSKGAHLIRERVVALTKKAGSWEIKTIRQVYTAKVLIGADGVSSLVRRSLVGELSIADKGVCCGYLAKGLEKEDITLRFLVHRKGYMWLVPRDDFASLGIGAAEANRSRGLRRELDVFIKRYYPHAEIVSRWRALIPNIKSVETFRKPLAGSDWILIGDAAGHVSPIIGEGILYALCDGELAARAIAEGSAQRFDRLWRETYGGKLFRDIGVRKWLYTGPGLEFFVSMLKLQSIMPF